ncbi:COX15/CtaA family protein [Nocardioides pacificus]
MNTAANTTDTLERTSSTGSRWLSPIAIANLVANIAIVVTGGAVRLTASGLGCSEWPRCTEESYVAHSELGIHGAIEFGNRMLTWVLVAIAVSCFVLMWRAGLRRATRLSLIVMLGIPLQAVIGGITVLTELNPWIVALHLLASMAIIGVCVLLLDELRHPVEAGSSLWRVGAGTGGAVRRLAWAVFVVMWVVLYLGTVVTGSGPHAGDLDARRNGLDPRTMSHLHAWVVYLLIALTVALGWLARRQARQALVAAAAVLLTLELAQGVLGFVQYFTDLPEILVGLHMLGAAVLSATVTWVLVRAHRA